MKRQALTAVIWLVITADYTAPKGQSADEKFKNIEDDFWRWRLQDAPEFASQVGDVSYNDVLESFNLSVYQTRKKWMLDEKPKLTDLNLCDRPRSASSWPVGGVDKSSLTTDRALDFDLLRVQLQTFLDGSRFDMYQTVNPVNFLEGITADPKSFHLYMPFLTVGDFENYLQRLTLLPKQIDEKIELMKIAVKLNHTLHNVSVVRVLRQIDKLVLVNETESPFYAPSFTTRLNESAVSEDRKESMRRRAVTAVGHVKEAVGRLKTFLEQEYMPKTRTTWGVHGLPNGIALYEECLRYHTSTNMTPQQVHDLGLSEMARIQTNMQAALKRLDFKGTIQEFYMRIHHDPQFHKNTSEELLETYRCYIDKHITPKLSTLFKNIPDYPLSVLPLPNDGPSRYRGGSLDGKVPGRFYANVINPANNPPISMMSLALHESLPGHHLQAIYSLTAKLPPYRAFTDTRNYHKVPAAFPLHTAYLEGWGLYAEFLGEEMGVYTDDYMLMGRYSYEIFRAVRLVVDTGLHYFGWERERAIQFIFNNTANSRQTAEVEIDRYLTWPAQATAYKIGEIKLKELRNKATIALGDRFDIRDFHSGILENGRMPLELLEQVVDRWIVSHQSSPSVSSGAAPHVSGLFEVYWKKPMFLSILFCWSVKGL